MTEGDKRKSEHDSKNRKGMTEAIPYLRIAIYFCIPNALPNLRTLLNPDIKYIIVISRPYESPNAYTMIANKIDSPPIFLHTNLKESIHPGNTHAKINQIIKLSEGLNDDKLDLVINLLKELNN